MDHMPDDLTNDYHLFGFDGDEYLHRDLASVVEDRVFEERDDPEFTVTDTGRVESPSSKAGPVPPAGPADEDDSLFARAFRAEMARS